MKKLVLISSFLLLISTIGYSQTTIYWEPEISVADGTLYGNVRPRIDLTSNNEPIVVFGKATNGLLYSAKWNGSTFNTPVTLLPPDVNAYLASWTGPDVASKGDTVIIVFKAEPMDSGRVYTLRSTDGGLTFSDTLRVDSHGTGIAWMPSLDIDADGNPTVIYMAHETNSVHPRYVVTHSFDQGESYQPEMDISFNIPEEACDCCPAEYVINGNDEVLLYRNNDLNVRDIFAVYSNDGGNTYPYYGDVDSTVWAITSCPSTGPHGIIQSGKLYTTFASKASGNYRVYLTETELNNGIELQNRSMLTPPTNSNGSQNYPRIDNSSDTIVMVWQESETSNNEIFCAYTTSGSTNDLLTSKHMVNTVTAGTQSNPDVKIANGMIHLVYTDTYSGDVIYRRGIIGNVGLQENSVLTSDVYPNPSASNKFIIKELNEKEISQIKLVDSKGASCSFELEESGENMELEVLKNEKGTYFLTIETGAKTRNYTLIIQ